MIKFFRNIRKSLFIEGKTSRYLKYAIGEIILVVIGILIALQINNWNEDRKAQLQEIATTKEIIENLKYDIIRYRVNTNLNLNVLTGLDSLRVSVSNTINGTNETVNIYYYTLKYAQDFNHVTMNRSAYNQLINSNAIKLIENRKLVESLTDYYERKTFGVYKYMPDNGLTNMKTVQKKFIQFSSLNDYIQSFDTMNDNTYTPNYDYSKILKMEDLKLLQLEGILLDEYLNEIAQFQIDLKTYNFYVSWAKEAAEKLILEIEKAYQLNEDKNL